MKTLLYIPLALAITLGTAAFAADEQSTGEIAREGQSTQQEIQGDARKLVAEIDATIDEYERNGLKGEEIDSLKKLRQVLSGMSDKDMAKILDLLQEAGAKSDPKASLKALVDAYSAQKGVLSQLQCILNDYATGQDALNLAKQARDLANRQAANLQTGIETAQWALRGGNKDNNTAAADFSMQAQSAEQKSIADALKQLQSKIAEMAANPDNQALAERFKKGLDEITALNPVLDSASSLLDQKKLFDAAASEKTARDGLRQLARTISPPRDEEDALHDASDQLDKIIALQKDLIPATDNEKLLPIEQWIEAMLKVQSNVSNTAKHLKQQNLPPAQLAQMDEYKSLYREQVRLATVRLSALDDQEGDIANQTDSLSQDIASVSKPVADSLVSAMPPMQSARGQLVDGDGFGAVKSETDALSWLEKAKALLDGRLADLEKADKTSDTADAGDLQKQAQDLLAQQTAIAKETAQPNTPQQSAALAQQQAALQQKTQDLQQQAATDSPAAAQALNAAANNMQQAATAMNNPGQSGQAQAQQQQAMQNLAAAGQQLGQQNAQAQQAAQQAAADQKELDALAKIIESEQKLQVDTAEAAPKQQKQPALVSALAPRQQDIRQDTDTFQKTLGDQAGAGANPQFIASASNHMGDAYGHLGKADGAQAGPDEKKALDDLYAAQKALQAAMDAAQNQAGDQNPQQQAQADQQAAQAAAALAQAQQQVAQAMNAMNQQTPAGQQAATNDLGQAATETGSAAAQDNALPGDAQQAMQNANQALAQAAGEAAAGQDAQAQASGQQAQADMAQAQAAMAQAQAGLAENGQGQEQGQGQGKGEQGQGMGQGQGQGGQGQGQGQGMGQGGQGQGQGTGQGGKGSGDGGNSAITGQQTNGNGQRTASKAQFMDLPPRDRATIEESQAEKYPPQYSTKVEQYLQNLADGSDKH